MSHRECLAPCCPKESQIFVIQRGPDRDFPSVQLLQQLPCIRFLILKTDL